MGKYIWVGLTLAVVLRGAVLATASEPAESLWHSDNRVFSFRVTPGDGGQPAHGVLYGGGTTDAGAEIWSCEILNAVAPGEVLVADSGRFVVTIDEWDTAGTGDNVVVIYGPDGGTTGRFSLDELLLPEEAGFQPRIRRSAGGLGDGPCGVMKVASGALNSPSQSMQARPLPPGRSAVSFGRI